MPYFDFDGERRLEEAMKDIDRRVTAYREALDRDQAKYDKEKETMEEGEDEVRRWMSALYDIAIVLDIPLYYREQPGLFADKVLSRFSALLSERNRLSIKLAAVQEWLEQPDATTVSLAEIMEKDWEDSLAASIFETRLNNAKEVADLQAEVERLKQELNESNKSLQKAEGEIKVALQEAFVAKEVSKFLMRDLGEHLEPFCEKMEKAKLEKALQEARIEAVREFAKWCDEEVPCGLTWTDDRGVHDIEAVEVVNRFIVEKYPW